MKKLTAMILVLLMVLAFTACGASKSEETTDEAKTTEELELDGGITDFDAGYSLSSEEADWSEEEWSEETNTVSDSGDTLTENSAGTKIIRTISLELETLNFDELTAAITQQAESFGGYCEESWLNSDTGSLRYATYTLRIPADQADAYIEAIGDKGSVLSRNETCEDVTLEYTDTEGHVKALEAEEDRLIEMMDMAETIEDLMAIESQLTEVRWQLESYQSQLNYLENKVDYTTITITVNEVEVITEVEEEEPGFFEKAWNRFKETCGQIGSGLEAFGVWILGVGSFFVVGIVILVIVIKVIRKKHRRKKEKQETLVYSDDETHKETK